MKQFDVAVIGGGLAGLAAAIEMSKKGNSVILFEKKRYPFHKVCGEYISMESWNYLQMLGLDLKALDLPKIDQLLVSDLRGRTLNHQLGLGGFGISRFKLDAMLAELAKASGVQLMEACRVEKLEFHEKVDQHRIESQEDSYYSKLLVASYGKRSKLDKQWQRNFIERALPTNRNFTAVKYHIKAKLPADQIGLHIFDGGYCGISKVEGEDRYCLCYLTLASAIQKAGGIEALEDQELRKNPFLNQYLDYPRYYERPEVIAQVNFSSRSQIEEQAFMLGDTAGLIVPLCGNGMSMALHSAHLWSGLANQYFSGEIDRKRLEQDYRKSWNQLFKIRLAVGRSLQTAFYKPRLSSLLIKFLSRSKWITGRLVALTHGKEILEDES